MDFDMETAEQKKVRERLRRYIVREGLTSCMNDTKWFAVSRAILAVPGYHSSFKVRCVMDREQGVLDPTRGDFPWHVPIFDSIEWLEFNPVVRTFRGRLVPDAEEDFTQQIQQALAAVHAPFSMEGKAIRVWGYLRPGTAPDFFLDAMSSRWRP